MLVQCGSSVELWENDVNHHEMIIFLCSCYLRCLLSNQNGSFVYVGTSQKPTCPHKKSAQNVDGEIILIQIVTQTAWEGTGVI